MGKSVGSLARIPSLGHEGLVMLNVLGSAGGLGIRSLRLLSHHVAIPSRLIKFQPGFPEGGWLYEGSQADRFEAT